MDAGARGPMILDARMGDGTRATGAVLGHVPAGPRAFSVARRADASGCIAGHHARARERWPRAVRIECATDFADAAEIAVGEGVAAPFVAPGDPSADTGAMDDPGAAHVRHAIAPVREAATAAGETGGITAPVEADAGRHLSNGATAVAAASGLGPLARGSDAHTASSER